MITHPLAPKHLAASIQEDDADVRAKAFSDPAYDHLRVLKRYFDYKEVSGRMHKHEPEFLHVPGRHGHQLGGGYPLFQSLKRYRSNAEWSSAMKRSGAGAENPAWASRTVLRSYPVAKAGIPRRANVGHI